MSWHDAQRFVAWLSEQTGHVYRLPSEAEFEYFLRAGRADGYGFDARPEAFCQYANGADLASELAYANQACSDGAKYTMPTASLRPNAFGLFDTHGNLWEWTQDCWHIDYADFLYFVSLAPEDGSPWISGKCEHRMLRGGSWLSSTNNLKASKRFQNHPQERTTSMGFRVVRDL